MYALIAKKNERGAKKNECLEIRIEDNGIGIDLKRNGDKIFGMYKTFHKNENAQGIGLYITKIQIEAMKGEISVKSKVGVGTSFRIIFND